MDQSHPAHLKTAPSAAKTTPINQYDIKDAQNNMEAPQLELEENERAENQLYYYKGLQQPHPQMTAINPGHYTHNVNAPPNQYSGPLPGTNTSCSLWPHELYKPFQPPANCGFVLRRHEYL